VGVRLVDLAGGTAWGRGGRESARPGADFVATTTRRLHRSDGGHGYVALRAHTDDVSVEQLRALQTELLCAVWEEMLQRRLTTSGPGDVRLNTFEANDGSLPVEIVGDVSTFKRLHFDPHSLLFAHLYEEPENLTGGQISLVDVHGYLATHGLQVLDAFAPLHLPGHDGRLVANDEHRCRMLEGHAQHVDPPGAGELLLLLVRNDPVAGVAHEIQEVRQVDSGAPTARRFFRASIAPHH